MSGCKAPEILNRALFRGHVPIPLGMGIPCGKVSPHVPDASGEGKRGDRFQICPRIIQTGVFHNSLSGTDRVRSIRQRFQGAVQDLLNRRLVNLTGFQLQTFT